MNVEQENPTVNDKEVINPKRTVGAAIDWFRTYRRSFPYGSWHPALSYCEKLSASIENDPAHGKWLDDVDLFVEHLDDIAQIALRTGTTQVLPREAVLKAKFLIKQYKRYLELGSSFTYKSKRMKAKNGNGLGREAGLRSANKAKAKRAAREPFECGPVTREQLDEQFDAAAAHEAKAQLDSKGLRLTIDQMTERLRKWQMEPNANRMLSQFKTESGEMIRYTLPDSVTVKDVNRFRLHLLTLAEDFDFDSVKVND